MLPTLWFRRKIQKHAGYYVVSIPPAIAQSLNCRDVDLVVDGGVVVIKPVIEDNKNEEINYEK